MILDAARGWLGGLASLVIVTVTVGILTAFKHYLPPDFDHGFLLGRRSYFWQTVYGYGFYLHIVGAPIALLCGLPQFSRLLLRTSPTLHRRLGKVYALTILFAVAPGAFIMSFWTRGGISAEACFLIMSILVTVFTILAWRAAIQQKFESHLKWMSRSYLVLVSAVVLRLVDPALRRCGVPDELSYQWSVWLSWVPSLILFELSNRLSARLQ
jgi:uncharacterized membrane protein